MLAKEEMIQAISVHENKPEAKRWILLGKPWTFRNFGQELNPCAKKNQMVKMRGIIVANEVRRLITKKKSS